MAATSRAARLKKIMDLCRETDELYLRYKHTPEGFLRAALYQQIETNLAEVQELNEENAEEEDSRDTAWTGPFGMASCVLVILGLIGGWHILATLGALGCFLSASVRYSSPADPVTWEPPTLDHEVQWRLLSDTDTRYGE